MDSTIELVGSPFRVNRVGLTAYRRLPLYPRQRTSSGRARQVRFVPILLQKSKIEQP
jgi:hypothetical protein